MASKARTARIWPAIALVGACILLGIILILLQPVTPLYFFIRLAALVGYLLIFFSALSSAYVRELVKWMGKPFLQVHHIVSVTGLAMIVLHPILVAIDWHSLEVFVPQFGSVRAFFENGGRPAWYLLAVASLAALLRKIIGQNWRTVHWLTYVTFWLGTTHALLIGPDIQNWPMRVIVIALALILVYVFVKRRVSAPKARKAAR